MTIARKMMITVRGQRNNKRACALAAHRRLVQYWISKLIDPRISPRSRSLLAGAMSSCSISRIYGRFSSGCAPAPRSVRPCPGVPRVGRRGEVLRALPNGLVLDGYCRSAEPARHRHGLSICVISRLSRAVADKKKRPTRSTSDGGRRRSYERARQGTQHRGDPAARPRWRAGARSFAATMSATARFRV